jgi:tetratricopeptide (TPR) repeat protein
MKRAASNAKSAATRDPASAPPMTATRSRRWLFRLLAMTLVPLLFLGGLELVLRMTGYGNNPDFFLPLRIGQEDFLVQNEDFSRRFFPGEVSRQPSALRMKANKSPGAIRIFVLGESAAMGDPEPSFGPSRHLEALLRLRYPQREFEVVNVAYTAINSHVILPIARECAAHDGDVWIVYMGNNEMVGPFGAATVFGAQSPPRSYVRLALAFQRTRVGQLGRALGQRWQKPGTPSASWQGMTMFLENQVPPESPKRMAAYRNFAGNLEDIVATGLDSGARVVLNTMAVNLRESPPFASDVGSADAQAVETLLKQGWLAVTNGAWTNAAKYFQQATALAPQHAGARFGRATCLQHLGDVASAREEFQKACDYDALPFRADAHINEAIQTVATRHADESLQLLDAPAAISRWSGASPCGDETFYEHVHFNFEGSYRLGLAWAQAVEQSLGEELGQPNGDWATQEASERALGLTDWNRKLITASVVQRLLQPPLSSQPNNPARVARLQQQEQLWLARMNRETLAQARGIYAAAIRANPEDHFLHEVHGNFLQVSGDLPGATQAWRRAAELMPHDFLPWFQLGVLNARQNQHAEAQRNFRIALQRRPGLVEGWVELGGSCLAAADWTGALAAFEQALRLRPQDAVLRARAARALTELGRHVEALAAYRTAVNQQPSLWEARVGLGGLLAQSGASAEAIGEFEAAVKLRPDHAPTRAALGQLLAQTGRMTEAITQFEEAVRLDPQNAAWADQLQMLRARLPRQP